MGNRKIKCKMMTRHLFVTPGLTLILLVTMALKIVAQTKAARITCNLFCGIAAKQVEQRCCAFYQPRKKPCNLILLRDRFERPLKRRATSLFNSFCRNVTKRFHVLCWAIPHLFERLFLISWENNRDCHITMPPSLKTMEMQIKGDQ